MLSTNSAALVFGVYGDKVYDETTMAASYFFVNLLIISFIVKVHYRVNDDLISGMNEKIE
jgi:hypothetical protein